MSAAIVIMATEGSTDAGAAGTFDLSRKLRQRLRETNVQKERTQAQINLLNDQLQKMFTKAPKRPRDTMEQMDDKIAQLEYRRTTTSLPLAEEKKILRQIDIIKRSKLQLAENEEHEKYIQDKKSEIAALKELLRTTSAAIAELEAALAKVELAKRLGVNTTELKTRIVDCPEGKIGQVIGKNGAGLRQLEDRTGVQVDVDKIGSKIHLHGSDIALDLAVEEVENITLSVEEDVELTPALVSYLLANRLAFLNKMQKDHPGVHFDLPRESSHVQLRGRPEKVAVAKEELLGVDVIGETRSMSSREISLVVGKGGATITKLVESHGVMINTDSKDAESPTLEIIGPTPNVEAAYSEIGKILFENEEVEESLLVEPMVRNNFLSDSGAVVKDIQSEISKSIEKNGGSVFLQFEKRAGGDMKSDSNLIIKANRTNMPIAKGIVKRRIKEVEDSIIEVNVDPDMIPSIIGKGGSSIKALREQGSGADIEVDRLSGKIRIQAEDDDAKQAVTSAIDQIVAENQVVRVEVEKSLIGFIFGEPGKEMKKKIIEEIGAMMAMDDGADTHIILRGTTEKINEAAEVLREFISNNYTEECEVLPDDEILLFSGGTDSFLKKLEEEHDVKANLRKVKHVVVVRGKKENVQPAIKELDRFLRGGDGFSVCSLKIIDGVLGIVIGKGGSGIAKLETDYEGVSVNVHRTSNRISVRGPEEQVAQCRITIIKTMSTARVTETVSISGEQYDVVSKPDYMRKLTHGIPVQVTVTETSVKIRGTGTDVRDAKALLNEQLSGRYETSIDLETSQLSKVSAAARDPSHFDRIHNATGANIKLDTAASAILISGKRSNAKKAKTLLFGFLDFLLPSEFAKFKVAKPMLKSMGEVSSLAEIAANSGASVCLDRDLSSVLVRSSEPENVQEAMDLLSVRLKECEKLNYVEQFDASDAWLLSKIIGKGGATVQKLQEETECQVSVSKEDRTVAISGESEDAVANAKDAFHELIAKARRECVFVDIPESAMSAFIGKSGANIKQLAENNDVAIERLRKEPYRVRIEGDEASVRAANAAVSNWLKDWESKHVGTTIPIEEALIPAILGKDGSVVSGIQKEAGCKIDIDRKALTLTVRGGREAQREEALKRIEAIVCEAKLKALEKEESTEEKKKRIQPETEPSKAIQNVPPKSDVKKVQPVDDAEERKNRTNEFAAVPVGLTIVEKSVPKNNGAKKRSKKKSNPVNVAENPQASEAGRDLFNLLLSDSNPGSGIALPVKKESPKGLSPADEQWDSSTVSSAAASSGTDDDAGSEIQSSGDKPYYKSASGFSVRV